jgi:argonaute-like protein implicated in RNA metabolism and viral defense
VDRLLARSPKGIDLAIVQIRDEYKKLRGNNNPYFVSKAAFMEAGIPVQAIKIENMEADEYQLAYILNNLALASYAKLDGTPWVISTIGPATHELIIGLGYTEIGQGRLGEKSRYVGITTVFQGDGRYLLWGLTREVEFDNYEAALLENLQTTIQYVKEENNWQQGDNVRLVFHVYKPLKNVEIEAIKQLVQSFTADRYRIEYAFLDLSEYHMFQIYDPSQKGKEYSSGSGRRSTKGKGVPNRGLCYQLSNRQGLLHLIGPGDMKTAEQGIPRPLLVELHPDSDFKDMTYLLRQIYHFTYMSWQNFFPASEPVTILYSRFIARMLGNLKTIDGWNSKVISVGSLRDRRWFL